jgi:hypothetical protein
MRRSLRVLIVLASTIVLVLALSVGTAFAGNTGAPTKWDCAGAYDGPFDNCDPADVVNAGSAVKEQTLGPILLGPAGEVAKGQFRGIDRNPFCLIHGAP